MIVENQPKTKFWNIVQWMLIGQSKNNAIRFTHRGLIHIMCIKDHNYYVASCFKRVLQSFTRINDTNTLILGSIYLNHHGTLMMNEWIEGKGAYFSKTIFPKNLSCAWTHKNVWLGCTQCNLVIQTQNVLQSLSRSDPIFLHRNIGQKHTSNLQLVTCWKTLMCSQAVKFLVDCENLLRLSQRAFTRTWRFWSKINMFTQIHKYKKFSFTRK